MAERSRRIGSIIGYLLVSVLGVAAGFAVVQVVAGEQDDGPTASAAPLETSSSTSSTTTTIPAGPVLSEVATADDALAIIDQAPAAPDPGVSVSVADAADIGTVVGSTAFVVSAPALAELDPPYLAATNGSPATIASGDKVVVMVALDAAIDRTDGLVAVVVYEQAGQPAEPNGPLAGATSAVAARLGRNDVIGSVAGSNGSFTESAPGGSLRVDGPLLTFVFDPVAPFRIVFARGFDANLDGFGINAVQAGPALSVDDLGRLGDVDPLVTSLTRR